MRLIDFAFKTNTGHIRLRQVVKTMLRDLAVEEVFSCQKLYEGMWV